jgi:UDP-glucose 4-epimerase
MTRRPLGQKPAWAKGLDIVTGDVTDRPSLDAALEGVDTVVHLAALNEVDSQANPDLALEINGQGTYRLLEACQGRSIKRFIYFSTFHVYGPGASQPITERTPTKPIHPYSITHRLAEDYVNWWRHSHGLDSLIIRLSNGYGYPADPEVQRWTLVFNDLCLQAVEKGEIVLRSSGVQQRDFITLHDVGRGVHHFLNLPVSQWGDGLFNLGGDCSNSILEAANQVASEFQKTYGREAPITTADPGANESAAPVQFSIQKLKDTGFSLTGDMSKEIQRTFPVCEQRLQLMSEKS